MTNYENNKILIIHTRWLLNKYYKKYKIYKRLKWTFYIAFWISKLAEFIIFTSVEILVENGGIPKFFIVKLYTFDVLCMYMITVINQHTEDLLKVVDYYGCVIYGITRWYYKRKKYKLK